MKWFVKCIQNYVTFSGRARRAEFWYFMLFYLIFSIVARILDAAIGSQMQIIGTLLSLFLLLPSLAVSVRRLHDIGRSGKNLLWYMITYVIWIVLLVATGLTSLLAMLAGNFDNAPMSFIVLLAVGGIGFLVWSIFFLVWFCTAGDQGENKYGPDPKAAIVE